VEDLFGFTCEYDYKELSNGLYVISPAKTQFLKIKYLAHRPMFGIIAPALEEATYINHVTGKPFVRTSSLYRELFCKAIVQIDFIDNDKLETIVTQSSDINMVDYNLVQLVCKHWLKQIL